MGFSYNCDLQHLLQKTESVFMHEDEMNLMLKDCETKTDFKFCLSLLYSRDLKDYVL